jgi:hypothetical protein
MEDVKQMGRDVEVEAKKRLRDADGHDLTDDLGNAGDEIRRDLGNAGDHAREAIDNAGDALRHERRGERVVSDPR